MTREQKVLRLNAEIIIGFGVLFALAAIPAVYGWIAIFFDLAHFPFNRAPEALDPTGRLMIAISGGLTVGLGVMVWTVATEVIPVAAPQGRKVVLYSAVGWFITDSTFSVVAGSPLNVILNLSFLLMMVMPLQRKGPAEADPAKS